ncbi:Hermansky-Pudlak syndrome 5 protein homolog [Aricia agestis]|uniref:Hermansky-Pudlak syndrome 5 protein homolog n=1 Tax=Aricia agestis TaxID=91739 RepID=UPI001C20AAB6|nr:Hermansky-Pudlak syndrome 5 protein homolog [Aricia agestis]
MSFPKLPPYILQELPDITETVKSPIKNVQRIKYTCFDISRSLIAFGATSGGIYVFNRWPCEFVQLIPNKDGPITRLAISIDEKHIGFANGKGIVTVTGCDQLHSGGYSSTSSKDHSGNEVTALIWSRNMLFSGDDIGKISVLQLQSFIAKTMFQSSSQIIMSLDSRICQLDCRESMLLVSTLTRCYICNIAQEQYRQIGQKLRDGEFGVCFASKGQHITNGVNNDTKTELTEVKKYDKVEDDSGFLVGEEFNNTVVFCARPSSRLWEATVDGMVRRTHQFKQVLSKNAMNIISAETYCNENVCLEETTENSEGQSVNFTKIFSVNDVIFAFNKSALYFLNVKDVDDTVWFNQYKDINECKIYRDVIYVWLSNGTLVNLRFLSLEKFLIKCFLDEKFTLCAELCALYKDFLMSRQLSPKLHILSALREKVQNNGTNQNLECIFDKFDSLKSNEVAQLKSGVYVVENSYNNQLLLDDDVEMKNTGDNVFAIAPDPLQALKGLQVTVSDKLISSKQRLKEKWEDFEEKMKHMSTDKNDTLHINAQDNDATPKWIPRDEYVNEDVPQSVDDIIYKESSQDTIEVDNNVDIENDICKKLYQYSRLSLVNKEADVSNLSSIIQSHACDINRIYDLMLSLENYCISIGVLDESKFVPNNIFLTHLNSCAHKSEYLDVIIKDETLYKYFVDSCIAVNIKNQMLMNIGCECGFPLPYVRSSQMPVFSELIDEFIEMQWSSQTKEQCYEVCKRMPHLWKKILYLRRNEDLVNVLRVLLQMLDENLLHSFLPQFTIDTWERAIQLYATLYANICLNCDKKFDHISVKDTLSWDLLGSLIIKSVGGKKAIELIKKHSHLVEKGALTIKFYHSCILVSLFEKFDVIIAVPLVNCLYSSYEYEESRNEVCKLLNSITDGNIKNTALPLTVAATSPYWGLKDVYEKFTYFREKDSQNTILHDILFTMTTLNTIPDCSLCGLPLHNEVLIQDGGLWVFKCGHTFHGTCLDLNKIRLCPSCPL